MCLPHPEADLNDPKVLKEIENLVNYREAMVISQMIRNLKVVEKLLLLNLSTTG